MRPRTILLSFALAASLGAQQMPAPNFAGEWTLDAARSTAVGGGRGNVDTAGGGQGGGLGLGPSAPAVSISQKGTTLRIDERRETETPSVTYRLDGSRESNALPAGRNAGVKATMVSRWQGSRLITTITLPATAEGGAATYEESRWLDPDGTMVVEIRRIGGPGLRRSIYRKTGR